MKLLQGYALKQVVGFSEIEITVSS